MVTQDAFTMQRKFNSTLINCISCLALLLACLWCTRFWRCWDQVHKQNHNRYHWNKRSVFCQESLHKKILEWAENTVHQNLLKWKDKILKIFTLPRKRVLPRGHAPIIDTERTSISYYYKREPFVIPNLPFTSSLSFKKIWP